MSRYGILDSSGNALEFFNTSKQAEAALAEMIEAEPAVKGEVAIVPFINEKPSLWWRFREWIGR